MGKGLGQMTRYSWFRVYHEAVFDRKLRRLPPWARWLWVTVLTMASMSSRRGYILNATERDFADTAGFDSVGEDAIDTAAVRWALAEFEKTKMIRKVRGGWSVVNFARRQYDFPSDRPDRVKTRVQRSRQAHLKSKGNTDVTRRVTTKRGASNGERREEKRRKEKRISPPTPPSLESATTQENTRLAREAIQAIALQKSMPGTVARRALS